jgi:hypothetical protein
MRQCGNGVPHVQVSLTLIRADRLTVFVRLSGLQVEVHCMLAAMQQTCESG